jgi:hypothetical protein
VYSWDLDKGVTSLFLREQKIEVGRKFTEIQGGPKKRLRIDLEEKCFRNSKIFFD